MPLYELEEGTSRKFYRIELEGRRVSLHWGRIGTDGTRQVLDHATESAAKAEYNRQILKRRERGYRLVHNEDVPHDPEAARRERLAKTAPLSTNPRFLFRNKKRKLFVWVEADGASLLTAEGPIGKEGDTPPRKEACASAADALKKRDRAVARLLEQGYELATVDAAEDKPKARRRAALVLKSNPELEALIRESPHDEDRWLVLEDWLLEQDDPRAEIVRHEKSGDRSEAAQARGRLHALLLGPREKAITKQLGSAEWRAGFMRACRFDLPDRGWAEALRALASAPAAALLHDLELGGVPGPSTEEVLGVLGSAPFAPSLRSLTLGVAHGGWIDAGLAAFERLRRLHVSGRANVRHDASLDRLEHLWLMPASRDPLPELFVPSGLRALRDLVLDVRELERGGEPLREDELRALLDGSSAPQLETLTVYWASVASIRQLLDALGRSKLLPRLRVLSFGGATVAPSDLPARHRGALAHLRRLELPKGVLA